MILSLFINKNSNAAFLLPCTCANSSSLAIANADKYIGESRGNSRRFSFWRCCGVCFVILIAHSSISFNSIEDILATEFFTVSAGEKLRVTDFSGKLIDKDFYHFSDFVFLAKDKLPTFAKFVPVVESAKKSTKKS